MRGEKSRRGRRSTTKKGRTAVWDIGRRRSLLHRWGRLSPATLCWLRRPQPQTRSRKVSYDLVREERGQVRSYRGRRLYRLNYVGFPANMHAEMIVDMKYTAPASKTFTVVRKAGPSGSSITCSNGCLGPNAKLLRARIGNAP